MRPGRGGAEATRTSAALVLWIACVVRVVSCLARGEALGPEPTIALAIAALGPLPFRASRLEALSQAAAEAH